MATPTAITRFTPVFKPLTNITPFTFRDGYTFLEMYEALRAYLTETLSPEIDAKLTLVYDEVQAQVLALADDVNASKDAWQALFDEFMANVIVELAGLNDQAVANLVGDELSQLKIALNVRFIQVVDAYQLYVNPVTGNDSAAGTQAAPFKTVKKAVDTAMLKTVKPDQTITIHLVAGTYGERIVFPDYTPFNYKLTVKGANVGGHPMVPSTVFTEGSNTSAVAFVNRNAGAHIVFEDIRFTGYKGTASSGGITNVNGTMESINCHFDNCYYGFTSFHGNLVTPSGKFTGCTGAGIRSMMNNRHVIGNQNAGTRDTGPIFDSNSFGMLVQENSTGHADWCTFTNNSRAIVVNVNSRVNCSGSRFVGNTIGVYLSLGSNTFMDSNVEMVLTGSQTGVVNLSNSTLLDSANVFSVASFAIGKTPSELRGNHDLQTITATEPTNIFLDSLKAGWFNEAFRLNGTPPKSISTRTVLTLAGADAKTVNVRHLGGNVAVDFGVNETGTRIIETDIKFISPTRQVMTVTSTGHLVDPRVYVVERTSDMNVDQDILLRASVGSAASSVAVHYTEFSAVI